MNINNLISEDEIIGIAKKLVSIEGHKDTKDKESKVADYIKEVLTSEDIETSLEEIEENRPNIYGYIRGEEDEVELMFNGHIDTIPGFQMDYPPFDPFVKDGKLYGRGSVDMKGALAAMISALIAVKRSGQALKKTAMFAGVIDEEECSKGTEYIIKQGLKPKMAVIGEPTDLNVCVVHKGMEWIEVTFKGRATHGSRPHEGINAIYAAAEFIKLIGDELEPKIEERKFDLVGSGTINVGVVHGGDDPNIVPDKCTVQIDRRWLPNETLESVHGEIEEMAQRAVDNIGGTYKQRAMREFTASMINTPHNIEINHPLVQEALASVEFITGEGKKPIAFTAWSDGALLSNNIGTECIVLGPGNINQAHANDEYCSVNQIIQATYIYIDLIKKFCIKGEI